MCSAMPCRWRCLYPSHPALCTYGLSATQSAPWSSSSVVKTCSLGFPPAPSAAERCWCASSSSLFGWWPPGREKWKRGGWKNNKAGQETALWGSLFTVGEVQNNWRYTSLSTCMLRAHLCTCVLSILSWTMPSFSSSLIRSVVSCSRPIRLIFPLFWTLEFFL